MVLPLFGHSAMDTARASIAAAARHLDADATDATRGVDDCAGALDTLGRLERALLRSANSTRPGDPRDLLLDIRDARAELLSHELARQRSMMSLVSEGLARLRAATTVDDLVESIPIETVGLGYERAMFSWADHEYWVPRSMHTVSGPAEAQTILAAGAPPYVHTRDLMEVDVIRNRRPILVLDCRTNPRVHPKITPVSRSDTYAAAPIVARNHVAAFVHLDRSVESGLNDEFDRDLLGLFCEGIGAMLDRLLAAEGAVADSRPREHVTDWVDALTPREHEVLRLVAGGLTNVQIANRLFISHETTKTHVKKLMRKLGAHTRSEAGAIYHRQGRTAG